MYKVILVNEKENKRYEAKVCKNLNEARLYCIRYNKYTGKECYHEIEKIEK
jgi:hypothetical protein